MSGRFVVGIDGSEQGQLALRWAVRLAEAHQASVSPVLAWDMPRIAMVPYPTNLPDSDESSFQSEYEAAAEALVRPTRGDHPDIDIKPAEVVRGEAGKELCRIADEADLLVLGSRGLGGFAGLMLGSVTAHCAGHAPCPVAVIPDSYRADAEPTGEYVVGVDGSAQSELAVRWADTWAPEGTTLRLIHAWEVPVTLDRLSGWIDPDVCAATAQQIADEAAAVVTHHQVSAEAVRTDARMDLPRLADDSDVLVIGARGHRGIGRLLLGSVASSSLHHLTVPTVIVR
jgi:nucleotide-binding universal stress UspA family protein